MGKQMADILLNINRLFYENFGADFSATRGRVQPGVMRALVGLPDEGQWLDLGCGNGSLAVEWIRRERESSYLGLDFSEALLKEARRKTEGEGRGTGTERLSALDGEAGQQISFRQADLSADGWADSIPDGSLRGVLAFAVLHHIPTRELRLNTMRIANRKLEGAGVLVHSVWQFQHDPRWKDRIQPWSLVGLDESALEPGDTLLDWRFTLPGRPDRTGLRYVHLFDERELAELAHASGFEVIETFESDGKTRRGGLYQVWRKR